MYAQALVTEDVEDTLAATQLTPSDTVPEPEDTYYSRQYDPESRSPLPLNQRKRPPLDDKYVRPSHFYSKKYARELKIDTSMHYTLRERIGNIEYRPPIRVPFKSYVRRNHKNLIRQYWKKRNQEQERIAMPS